MGNIRARLLFATASAGLFASGFYSVYATREEVYAEKLRDALKLRTHSEEENTKQRLVLYHSDSGKPSTSYERATKSSLVCGFKMFHCALGFILRRFLLIRRLAGSLKLLTQR